MSEQVITIDHLNIEAAKGGWMTEMSTGGLGQAVWGFLNTCLAGAARACFEAAESEQELKNDPRHAPGGDP